MGLIPPSHLEASVGDTQEHPLGDRMLRFYEKHNLASELFLLNKETQLEFFLKLCSGNQSVIAGVCIFDMIAASMRAVFH